MKRSTKRKTAPGDSPDESDDSEEVGDDSRKTKTAKPSKHKKKKKADTSDSEDDEPEKPTEPITIYVYVVTQPCRPKGKPTVKKSGPFFLKPDMTTFPQFVTLVARSANSLSSTVILDKLEWKFDAPKNDPTKPLSSNDGYTAMLDMHAQKVEKKQKPAIIVCMPPGKRIQVAHTCLTADLLNIKMCCFLHQG